MKRNGLMIGTYYLAPYASTEEHVKDLADCGIDVVMNMRNDRSALDLLARHGVGAVVSGVVPGWFGGDGSNAGTMAQKNPLEKYEQMAAAFEDHPAVIGIDAGDEPSSADFAHYGQVMAYLQQRFPGKIAYLNIYPSYAVKGSNTPEEIVCQLGTDTYGGYIERYVQQVNTPYICFDYYLYSAKLPGLYESLTTVSRACRRHRRDMWMVLQVNSHQPEVFISEKQLRFQANCAMAFGARAVIWACYCAGWWHNHVLDRQGNRTEQYDKLRRVNRGLHRLGEICMQYRHEDTLFVGGFTEEELAGCGAETEQTADTACFADVHAQGARLLVGRMSPAEGGGGEAVYIAVAEDPAGQAEKVHTVHFCCKEKVRALGMDGDLPVTRHADGSCTIELESCQGAVLVAE